jgi:UrcA family protein
MNAVTLPLAAAATALTLVFATLPAHAGTPASAESRVAVRYADLDLASDAGAAALYQRIAAAAREVCPGYFESRHLLHRQAVRECRESAIARAIEAIDSPRLAAIQAARTSRARAS